MDPVEITHKTHKKKAPSFNHSISWLGGASFGRSRRPVDTPRKRQTTEGRATLMLLSVAFVYLFQGCDLDKPLHTVVASALLLVVGAIWLRCFERLVHPYLRVAANTLLSVQIWLYLPFYLLRFISVPR